MNALSCVMAVLYETLRLFPPVCSHVSISIWRSLRHFSAVANSQIFCGTYNAPYCPSRRLPGYYHCAQGHAIDYQHNGTPLQPWAALITGYYEWCADLRYILARYWPDPMTFKPSRFLEDWPKDAFLPFSAGVACYFFSLDEGTEKY